MFNDRLFDVIQSEIENGYMERGLHLLAGTLISPEAGVAARPVLHQHPLHAVLMEDPYLWRASAKPRGYAGDAQLIDMIYDMSPPADTGQRGREIFRYTIDFPVSVSVRNRRDYMEVRLGEAWAAGKRICSLACGHLREADGLIGKDLNNIVAVDQDPLSLAEVARKHGANIQMEEANVLHYLRSAASRGEKYDLIYTLGLTDYLDDRAMRLLHKLMKACLAPGGQIFLANFVPEHLARGWLDAVMDWHLIYRTEAALQGFAREIGMTPKTWTDPTGCIAYCEMG
jgi:extracellular factor (EF) 3-hydroxypalmitic acid methyl ester biosynthesis protein